MWQMEPECSWERGVTPLRAAPTWFWYYFSCQSPSSLAFTSNCSRASSLPCLFLILRDCLLPSHKLSRHKVRRRHRLWRQKTTPHSPHSVSTKRQSWVKGKTTIKNGEAAKAFTSIKHTPRTAMAARRLRLRINQTHASNRHGRGTLGVACCSCEV
jgi:hypothetical protein